MKSRVIQLGLSSVDRCPRAVKISQAVKNGFQFNYYHCELSTRGVISKIVRTLFLIFGGFNRYLEILYKAEKPDFEEADIVICHDLVLLPLICQSLTSQKLVLDAREFYPAQFEDNIIWRYTFARLYDWILCNYLCQVQVAMTVSQGISNLYLHRYNTKFEVVPSYAKYVEIEGSELQSEITRLVHLGVSNPNRDLEVMLDAFSLLPSTYSLDLFLLPTDSTYFKKIANKAAKIPGVNIRKPVAQDLIVETLNNYDIGIFVPPARTINLDYSLPNKLFEYLQGRLAIVSTPLTEMRKFIIDNNLGRVSENFSPRSIASAVLELNHEEIKSIKCNAGQLAKKYSIEELAPDIDRLLSVSD